MTGPNGQTLIPARVSGFTWMARHTFEIRFERPPGFEFLPGQKIGVVHSGIYRDYSLTSSVGHHELVLCVRHITEGELSSILARAKVGDAFHITPAFGFFLFRPSNRPAVFVATGTGIAPFVAFARAGAQNHLLLHGVRSAAELYYRDVLTVSSKRYLPCITGGEDGRSKDHKIYYGRVTDYLTLHLATGEYDFYLCGRGEMLRDATRIIDRRFPESRIFSELFF